MGTMRRFTSRYANRVDKKGRVSVPATFRAVLEEGGGAGVYLKRNQADGAIDGLTEPFMDDVQQRIDALDIGSEDRTALEDEYFAESVELRFDPEGRIILPRELMEFAEIQESALFVGLGTRFQIWNPDAYEAHRAERAARAKTLTLSRPASASSRRQAEGEP